MESEASAIARKIENYIVIENEGPSESAHQSEQKEVGMLRNILLISLMGAAVLLTQATLLLVKWTKKLEG